MSRISITSGDTAGNKRRAATHYGARDIEDTIVSKHAISQGKEKLEVTFNYDDLPGADLDEAVLRIPAGSQVVSAHFHVHEAFVGGTSLSAGTIDPDGNNGLAAALIAATVTADIDAVGDHIVGAGATVGVALLAEKQVTCTAVGVYTAGKATLVVEYEPSYARA